MASREGGFTLVETLVGATLALILMMASLTTLERAWTANKQVSDRVDAAQRARQAMDAITRQLRSAVCPDPLTAALISGSANSMSFFVDLSDGSRPPAKHTLSFDAASGTISESRYDGVGASPGTIWPATPTATRVVIANVSASGSSPFLRFNAYDSASPPRPTVVLASPLTPTGLASASRITIMFTARPTGRSTTSPQSTSLEDQIDLRSTDPNQPKPAPQCT